MKHEYSSGDPGGPGRPAGTGGAQHKRWLLNTMIERLKADPALFKADLDKLRLEDFAKYLEIVVKLMPKEHRLENVNQDLFAGKSTIELEHFAATGEWLSGSGPEESAASGLDNLDADNEDE